jgi:uncharacterized membrane protein
LKAISESFANRCQITAGALSQPPKPGKVCPRHGDFKEPQLAQANPIGGVYENPQLFRRIGTSKIATLGLSLSTPAQQQVQTVHHHYKFVELGTLGGPNSYFTFSNRSLSNSGIAAGTADTSTPVNAPLCFIDCFLIHTFLWKDGSQTDLGGLPGVAIPGSQPNYINEKGVVAGTAFNGGVDDVMGVPQFDGVIWKDGQIIDLGTFGGLFSYAAAINDRDEAVGFALKRNTRLF